MKLFKNKKYWLSGIIAVFLAAAVCGCLYGNQLMKPDRQAEPDNVKRDIVKNKVPSIDMRVEEILSSMSMNEKVGQMMMIGIQGTAVNEDSLYMLQNYHVGGVVLFDRNLKEYEQVKKLNSDLQEQAKAKLPLLIGIDEEGGRVVRMKELVEPPPSQQEIGDAGDLVSAREWAAKTAKALKAMGFNLNFAPVVDVGSSDTRSYSKNPEIVANFVNSAAQGYEQEKMLYSLKHFPGIGKGKVDTHIDSYSVTAPQKKLEAEDIVPFKAIFQQRAQENYLVMISHLIYKAYDKQHPASLSNAVVTDLLRNKLNYNGLVITDDLEMGAIAKHYDFSEMGVRAVKAGVDIVLVCHEYEHAAAVYKGIIQAVQTGQLSEERINESVRRIIRVKLLHL